MKLFFNVLLTIGISNSLEASKIVIRYQTVSTKEPEEIKKIFRIKYNIPESLIVLIKRGCSAKGRDERFLYLCINKKGELLKFSPNIQFKVKSLLVFKSL